MENKDRYSFEPNPTDSSVTDYDKRLAILSAGYGLGSVLEAVTLLEVLQGQYESIGRMIVGGVLIGSAELYRKRTSEIENPYFPTHRQNHH